MLFYDFEVFKKDWLVVAIDMVKREEHIIVNDKKQLEQLYNDNKNNIWIGFNSRHYDQYIFKGILAGFNPKEINDFIIVKKEQGWKFSNLLRNFPLNNYDVMTRTDRGLKTFEGFMGNDIRESSVPFDIDRKLTPEEIDETIKYCRHDVEQTIEVFLQRKSDFEAQMLLLKMFNLPLSDISKTKVQLSAKILDAKKPIEAYDDEFDISFPETMKIKKYINVVNWYKNPENLCYFDPVGNKKQYIVNVAGIPTTFGWGGVHGAREKYSSEGYFINMDVASLYPSLMIQYNLHSRSCNPEKFNDIVNTRLQYKAEKNPLQATLKIVINGTYGAMKDKNNPLYDPRPANNVCVYGQLLLLDLMEHLENYCEIIQCNTDGILIKMPTDQKEEAWYQLIDDIAYEWEKRTGLQLEFDEYRKVYQKDVNNYVIVDGNGNYKSKGAYVKKLNNLDYDLPIVNKAMIDYIVRGIPVEYTILHCNDLKEFQQVKKISGKYKYILHGSKKLVEKCIRCFASIDESDCGLVKIHAKTHRAAKIENTPEHCFLMNNCVNNCNVINKLNKRWYIELAEKRLKDFGVS